MNPVRIAALAVIAITASLLFNRPSEYGGLRRLQEKDENNKDDRPIMYTFYGKYPEGMKKRTGMTDEDDEALLAAWTQHWSDAGWNPQVLTLETAQEHPIYQQFVDGLEGLPFGFYDKLCFIRWLAMAHIGGGWTTDYDTFPLNDFRDVAVKLPNDGRFTSFQNIVPSLISATGPEYLRMALQMADNARRNKEEKHWSDMLALQDMYERSHHDLIFNKDVKVLNGAKALNGVDVWGPKECSVTEGMRAVHFSHESIRVGNLKFKATASDRPKVASDWLKMWKSSCVNGKTEKQEKASNEMDTSAKKEE